MKLLNQAILIFLFMNGCSSFLLCSFTANSVVAVVGPIFPLGPAKFTGAAITNDGKFAYIANSSTLINALSVIDTATNTFLPSITGFDEPYAVVMDPVRNRAYVSNSGTAGGMNTVSVVDLATNTISHTIAGFYGPAAIVVSPDGRYAYVTNFGFMATSSPGNTVSVVDLDTLAIIDTITVADYPTDLALSPDGTLGVVCYGTGLPGEGLLYTINSITRLTIDSYDGLSGPISIAAVSNYDPRTYVPATPASTGPLFTVANFGAFDGSYTDNTLSNFSLEQQKFIDKINVPPQPSSVTYFSSAQTLYVTSFNGSGGALLQPITLYPETSRISPIPLGVDAVAMGLSRNSPYAYITDNASNNIFVIAVAPFVIKPTGCRIRNTFLSQVDLINKVTWTVSGEHLPLVYSIYSDPDLKNLLATIQATQPFEFMEHNIVPNKVYTYYIVGTNEFNVTSNPVMVTINRECF